MNKMIVVGNIAGGKTLLSQSLAQRYSLPLTHVDSLQFLPGLKLRPHQETQKILDGIMAEPRWLIDGFGPLNAIEKRFADAEVIVFVDLPIWRHYFWLVKRQLGSIFGQRNELPANCNELRWGHNLKLFQTVWRIHKKMRPELLKIFQRESLRDKVRRIHTTYEFRQILREGL